MIRGYSAFRALVPAALAWALAASSLLAAADAPPFPVFQATAESRVRISGRATIGSWHCETSEVIAAIEPGPDLVRLAHRVRTGLVAAGGALARGPGLDPQLTPSANISIPVASLQCAKPGMRGDLMRALRANDAPLIVFILTAVDEVRLTSLGDAGLGWYDVRARGDLVLAGVQRPIQIRAEVRQETPDRFRIRATHVVDMEEFGITPPTAFLGLIRVDARVQVDFDLVFQTAE